MDPINLDICRGRSVCTWECFSQLMSILRALLLSLTFWEVKVQMFALHRECCRCWWLTLALTLFMKWPSVIFCNPNSLVHRRGFCLDWPWNVLWSCKMTIIPQRSQIPHSKIINNTGTKEMIIRYYILWILLTTEKKNKTLINLKDKLQFNDRGNKVPFQIYSWNISLFYWHTVKYKKHLIFFFFLLLHVKKLWIKNYDNRWPLKFIIDLRNSSWQNHFWSRGPLISFYPLYKLHFPDEDLVSCYVDGSIAITWPKLGTASTQEEKASKRTSS